MPRFRAYVRQHHLALLALFVALGGTSYAASRLPANSVGNKQLKHNAVTLSKIAGSARHALVGQRGPKGATGSQGPRGDIALMGNTTPCGGSDFEARYGPVVGAAACTANETAVTYAAPVTGSLTSMAVTFTNQHSFQRIVVRRNGSDTSLVATCNGGPCTIAGAPVSVTAGDKLSLLFVGLNAGGAPIGYGLDADAAHVSLVLRPK